VETYLALVRRDNSAAVQHLQQYKQTHDTHAQGQVRMCAHVTRVVIANLTRRAYLFMGVAKNGAWVNLQVMYDILSLEHAFVDGDVPRAKAHAKSICTYVQVVYLCLVVVSPGWCS
jgi:hypothetical protein